jgi:hypothetical protein
MEHLKEILDSGELYEGKKEGQMGTQENAY